MKEMRLFEIGFKEDPNRTGYEEKVKVAAENAHDAEDKARGWILEKHIEWWEETGREDEIDYRTGEGEDTSVPAMSNFLEERLDGIREMHLAKLYDVGTLIV